MSGKGSMPRPFDCSKEHYDSEFERIFGIREPQTPQDTPDEAPDDNSQAR